jgi:hypothetical protein
MARSKNRVLEIEECYPELYITAQVQLANGEVVIGGFKCTSWHKPPSIVAEDMHRRMSNGPVGTFGKLKAPDQ